MIKTKKPKSRPVEDLSIADAAAYANVSRQYLYQCRLRGTGPVSITRPVTGLGKGPNIRVFYAVADLDAWIVARAARLAQFEANKFAKETRRIDAANARAKRNKKKKAA
jgi:hypothetical protein